MTAQELAHRAVSFLLVVGGTGACLGFFVLCAMIGDAWRSDGLRDDEACGPPRRWLYREGGE